MSNMGNQAEVVQRPETWRDESVPVVSRIAFVSGGMGGIGSAICRRLGRAGHTVIAGCLPGYEKKAEWLERMRGEGFRVHAAEGDVSEFESCAEMFYHVRSVVGPVDILVNNAGITRDTLVLRMKEEDWSAVINTNLGGAFYCIKAALREFLRARSGRIINITSVAGQIGAAGQANYAAAKAGLIGLTRSVAREVASRGITVNAVAPGFIDAGMTMQLPADLVKSYIEQVPLGRAGKPEEVAAAVVFLASDEAAYITGQVINVDGGLVMR